MATEITTLASHTKSQRASLLQTLTLSGLLNRLNAIPFEPKLLPTALLLLRIDFLSSWKKGSLGRGRSGTSAQNFVLCVFLCVLRWFSPANLPGNFFQKLPLQCRHFLENPLAKNPKTQLLNWFPQNYRYRYRLEIRMKSLITITITVLESAVTPSFPLIPKYHVEFILTQFPPNYPYRYRLEMFLN